MKMFLELIEINIKVINRWILIIIANNTLDNRVKENFKIIIPPPMQILMLLLIHKSSIMRANQPKIRDHKVEIKCQGLPTLALQTKELRPHKGIQKK